MSGGKRFIYPNEFQAHGPCHGKGKVYCSPCTGRGYSETTRYDSSGYSHRERQTCTICHGSGERMCDGCGGTGDELIYHARSAGIEDATSDTAGVDEDFSSVEPYDAEASKRKYAALHTEKLAEAEQRRDEIIQWVWNSDFDTAYKSKFDQWLSTFNLNAADAEMWLLGTATQLDQSATSTQAGTLSLTLRGLALLCGTADMYRNMSQ